ncbi:MAG: SDR family NAD(P)-dependent oxidoreductase [Gammaproteobacteria bacterium]|nr:SDR family NAD(P)-dependent oxidoreductase [Gammaproteobacteria bacterium]
MSDDVFITGTSSGLGRALAEEYLERGREVYGLSRRPAGIESPRFHEARTDLGDLDAIAPVLDKLLGKANVELAILNAGMLGEFKPMPELRIDELHHAMDVNVWANKQILDWFAAHRPPGQIVLISSGAAVSAGKGWGSYALSKATLNMLVQLYAHDLPDSHLVALAPGLVHTAMQDQIHGEVDTRRFPSVKRLKEARGTAAMPGPREAAQMIAEALPAIRERRTSGDFVDIRDF